MKSVFSIDRCWAVGLILVFLGWCEATASYGTETRNATAKLSNGKTLDYVVVLPDGFDDQKTYPVLLALPPGAQNRQMVRAGLDLYWRNGEQGKGWIIVSPVAPAGKFFNSGAENLIPQFLDEIEKEYQVAGGKFHLAGVSNGGTSAFRIAGKYTERFHSLMALPGYPSSREDRKRLKKIAALPVALFVGEQDKRWIGPMQTAVDELKALKADVSLEIVPGAGHVVRNWQDGKKLFAILNRWHSQATQE